MSAANMPEAGAPKRGFGSAIWIQGLACGALLTFATPTAVLLATLLAPAIVCLLANPGCERGLLRAVVSSCMAGSLGPLWHLWLGGGHMDDVVAILASPATLCLAWGGGASAWALCQILPVIVHTACEARESTRAKSIQIELDELTNEWSLNDPAEQK